MYHSSARGRRSDIFTEDSDSVSGLVARGVRLRLFIFGERGLCSVPTLSASSMLATYDAYEVRYVLGGRYEVWKAVFATDEASHESAQPSGL